MAVENPDGPDRDVSGKVYSVSCCGVRDHTRGIVQIVKGGEACSREVGRVREEKP